MVLLDLLAGAKGVKGLSTPLSGRKTKIDGVVFALHYKLTCGAVLTSALLLGVSQLVGPPMQCYGRKTDSDAFVKFMNAYCLFGALRGTATVTKFFDELHGLQETANDSEDSRAARQYSMMIGTDATHPGIVPSANVMNNPRDHSYHGYYLWVPLILLCSGASFRLGRWIWKYLEKGKLSTLLAQHGDRQKRYFLQSPKDRDAATLALADYLRLSKGHHDRYLMAYFLCELLNLAVVILNFVAFDWLLEGRFWTLGLEYWRYLTSGDLVLLDAHYSEDILNPMLRHFPRVTKCEFHDVGPTGSIQNHDYVCILAMNILNEKIFFFLWCWFLLLTAVTAASMIFWIFLAFPTLRPYLFLVNKMNSKCTVGEQSLDIVLDEYGRWAGDSFLLFRFGQNLSSEAFGALLDKMAEHVMASSNTH